MLRALQAGHVDVVALAADLPARLLAWLGRPLMSQPGGGPLSEAGTEAGTEGVTEAVAGAPAGPGQTPEVLPGGLPRILSLLRDKGRHDFTQYKTSTVLRRVERRLGIHGLSSLTAYAHYLESNEQELDLLFKELLIGVTSFFRDTPVWQALKNEVLPALLASRGPAHQLRAWVVGCSTGEEAFSLAMTYREVQAEMPGYEGGTLQIFATDLSPDAIDSARRGFFRRDIAGEVSAQRLATFFTAERHGYRIKHTLRDMVVFAPHDVVTDPPFTRLDFLSCRNLLIYLTVPLQDRLLPLFHYTLRPGGVLLLGSSETQGRFDRLFAPLDPKLRLYRRIDAPGPIAVPDFPLRPAASSRNTRQETRVTEDENPPSGIQAAADSALLQYVAPPAVLVNAAGDILYINGRTGKYLEPTAGRANWNIHVMAREGLRAAIGSAITKVLDGAGVIELPGLSLESATGTALVDVSVRALTDPGPLHDMVMISFRDAGAATRPRRRPRGTVHRELEAELQHVREECQSLREDMRAHQEEAKAAHEELQSANEELQSTNEELTSSKEELQSMNEELQAVNAELRSKLEDLELAQSDMRNLLNSTDIATLFLDLDLNVRRFTDRARNIISLRDSDIGRPLGELTTQLEYTGLETDVREMLRTLVPKEAEIRSREGQWYSMRVLPYRTQDNTIAGAVITFVDITAAKDLEARLRSA
jgi:two-component system, chemotaxis family, CheB/CheR fusion protein